MTTETIFSSPSDENPNIVVLESTAPNLREELKQYKLLRRLFLSPMKLFRCFHSPQCTDRSLRTVFLIFIILIGISSFTTALILGSTVVQFKQQCLLYATFQFKSFVTRESNWTIRIVPLSERFSPLAICDFCTFSNVFTFIYCIMTGFFFILFKSDNQIMATNDRCLIIPWFPISIILSVFSLVNASILTNGFLKLCSTITSNDPQISSCTQLNQFYFEQYPNVSSLFVFMVVAIISSWLQLAFFIGIIAVLTIRLSISFDWNHQQEIDDKSMEMMIRSIEQT